MNHKYKIGDLVKFSKEKTTPEVQNWLKLAWGVDLAKGPMFGVVAGEVVKFTLGNSAKNYYKIRNSTKHSVFFDENFELAESFTFEPRGHPATKIFRL